MPLFTRSDDRRSPISRRLKIVLAGLLFCVGIWGASEWWEKALAKPAYAADISPDGCFRVQTFRPFWLLPGFLHPQAHPDDSFETRWFVSWESPAFFRLYDNRDGQLLGESEIYDLVSYGDRLSWGYGSDTEVRVGLITIGNTRPDCKKGD
jgi:hypothetical protein